MNKLTEIKQCIHVLNNEAQYTTGAVHRAETKIAAEELEWIEYLLSLLEEKDKALAFYADENNYLIEYHTVNGMSIRSMRPEVNQDGGEIARKALNTSSNNEGD